MLTLRDPVTGDPVRVRAPQGTTLAVGCAVPADTVTCTLIRVLLVGDILRRTLEDLHHIPVASAVISDDPDILHRAGVHAATIAPPIDVLPTIAAAQRAVGKPLDILVATHHCARQDPLNSLAATTTVIQVGPVHWVAPGQHCDTDPATLRYVLALAPYRHELVLTSAMLDHGEEQLHRWRQRMSQWSTSRTHPIPYLWRAAIVTALEDNLDVAAAVDTMNTLEHSTAVTSGAKFQALAFLDRFLATDLTRTANHESRPPAQTP